MGPTTASAKVEGADLHTIKEASSDVPIARQSPVWHMVASQGASAASTLMLFPLDVVKMRFMSQDGTVERMHNRHTYSGTWSALREIAQQEGIGALYRGWWVAVLGSALAWGFYMLMYKSMAASLSSATDSFAGNSIASIVASITTAAVVNPIFLVKTRMQIEEQRRAAERQAANTLCTFRGAFLHVLESNGWRGLWRGLTPQILLGIPHALHLPLYELVKGHRLRQKHHATLSVTEVLVCTVVTKTVIMLLAHPLFVLKTRIQDRRGEKSLVSYTGIRQSLTKIAQREGIRGLYRGIGPALFQSIPRSVLHFFFYESLLKCAPQSK